MWKCKAQSPCASAVPILVSCIKNSDIIKPRLTCVCFLSDFVALHVYCDGIKFTGLMQVVLETNSLELI
jgi:hypothetical protein